MRKSWEWISLSISSFSLYFLPLSPFPPSLSISYIIMHHILLKMLNTALLSRMSQKSQHTRYEEIILGRTCCEEAPLCFRDSVIIQFIIGCPQRSPYCSRWRGTTRGSFFVLLSIFSSDPSSIIALPCRSVTLSSCNILFKFSLSKMIHGFIQVVERICQKLIHGFL